MLLSRQCEKDSRICRKDSSGQFKCPSNEPPSILLAIPWYPKSQSSLLIEPSGNFFGKKSDQKFNFIKNCIQVLSTSIATVDSTDLIGRELEWGCSVFFRNELLIFGVHESAPNWSSVSYEAEKLFYYKILDFKTNEQVQTRVPPRKTRKIVPSNTL